MKIFIIFNHQCQNDITPLYKTIDEAKRRYDNKTLIVEAPEYVFENWGYDESKIGNERFIKPIASEGWLYDENTGTFYKEISNREKRELFYKTGTCMNEKENFFVEIDDKKLTVDSATTLGNSYEYRDEIEKSNEIKELVKRTVKEIREKYPD